MVRNRLQFIGLAALILLVVPFAIYAINFGQGGLRDALPKPHYIRSSDTTANGAIFTHMILGGLITTMIPLQLIGVIRTRVPVFHRWSGRIITIGAAITALGGLIYIGLRGTIGGLPMDVGFTLYGILMLTAALQTIRHARRGQINAHHAWALRLFWLVLGSWLYRVHYGLWYAATGGAWSNPDFSGPFDLVQNFAFYVPYLIGVEIYLARKRYRVAVS
ncbi:DUF2306 domain-containing protein [Yoonia sp. 2307UL14-13]|uniref:DUF2306 domain-containing protein n=1 Tax=Yoonia sp. 2307UL14-13 TaxID=3126506 RepID=UPI0030B72B0E